MLTKPEEPRIPLPKSWQGCVKSAVLHAIALAHYAIVYARGWPLKQTADTFLVDVLQRISEHPASQVGDLTPRVWKEKFSHNPMKSDLALAEQ